MRSGANIPFLFVGILSLPLGCAEVQDGPEESVARHSAALQMFEETTKLVPDDGSANQYFGQSLAMSSDSVIVGAPGDSAYGISSGAAYIITKDGSQWSSPTKLVASNPEQGVEFGFSVGIDGDSAIVSAYLGSLGGSFPGTAYVFSRDGDVWSESAMLAASDGQDFDLFGCSVAISGDFIGVGARESAEKAGAVYIFSKDGPAWLQQVKLTPPDGVFGDAFGSAIAMDGALLVAGAPSKDCAKGKYCGAAYIYQRSSEGWAQVAKLVADTEQPYDFFGRTVAISGTTVAVGTYLHKNKDGSRGAVYIYDLVDSSWVQTAKIKGSDATATDSFGVSVALDGDQMAIGALSDEEIGVSAGSAYVFSKATGSWVEGGKLVPSDGDNGDAFGRAVAVRGGTIAIGAYEHDNPEIESGAVYVLDGSGAVETGHGGDGGSGGAGGAGGGGAGGPCCATTGGSSGEASAPVPNDEDVINVDPAKSPDKPKLDEWYAAGGGLVCNVSEVGRPTASGIVECMGLLALALVGSVKRGKKAKSQVRVGVLEGPKKSQSQARAA